MNLTDKIEEQYKNRQHKAHLYVSEYSRMAVREKSEKCIGMVLNSLKDPQSVLEIGAGLGQNVPLLRKCGFENIVLNELLPNRVALAKKKISRAQNIFWQRN